MSNEVRLRINEIFHSVQGEGTRIGLRCVFIRTTGCHLRCTYCDTEYAFFEGGWKTLDGILGEVRSYACPLVCVTGGEPLLQPGTLPLLGSMAGEFETVLLETSGALPIGKVDARVVRIVDIKCPGSGESERNCWENMALLTPRDEVKFIVSNRADYDWAREVIERYDLVSRCAVIVGPVFGGVEPVDLATWVLEDRLDVRVGLQLHKLIWPTTMRGV